MTSWLSRSLKGLIPARLQKVPAGGDHLLVVSRQCRVLFVRRQQMHISLCGDVKAVVCLAAQRPAPPSAALCRRLDSKRAHSSLFCSSVIPITSAVPAAQSASCSWPPPAGFPFWHGRGLRAGRRPRAPSTSSTGLSPIMIACLGFPAALQRKAEDLGARLVPADLCGDNVRAEIGREPQRLGHLPELGEVVRDKHMAVSPPLQARPEWRSRPGRADAARGRSPSPAACPPLSPPPAGE